jgi:hypothetical protein
MRGGYPGPAATRSPAKIPIRSTSCVGAHLAAIALIIAAVLMLAARLAPAQVTEAGVSPEGRSPAWEPQILSNLDDPPEVAAQRDRWRVGSALIMYQDGFDPRGVGVWSHADATDRWLANNVPEDYDGVLVLDWEGGVMEHLRAGPSDPGFGRAVREMVRLLEHVKLRRPAAVVGYYGLPFVEYWGQGRWWRESAAAMRPVFDASDALFPSVYDYYGQHPERDHERFSALVRLALEHSGGKPVFMYTYHRYDHWDPEWRFRRIGRDEYVAHISKLMNVEFNGRRPAGVIAWGMERYFYRAAFARAAGGSYAQVGAFWDRVRDTYAAEMDTGETIDEYATRLHPYVYCLLSEAVLGRECDMSPP